MRKKLLFTALAAVAFSGVAYAEFEAPLANRWYRLVSYETSDERANRCVELLTGAIELPSGYKNNNSQANRLWGMEQVTDATDSRYPYQYWQFQEDPENEGLYAMVSLANPEGSVTTPSSDASTSTRWDYDTTAKHYIFRFNESSNGTNDAGNHYAVLVCPSWNAGQAMNMSLSGQGCSMNAYITSDVSGSRLSLDDYLVDPTATSQWYQIQTQYSGSTTERRNRVLDINGNGVLWFNSTKYEADNENIDNQLWTLIEDPDNAGHFAIVRRSAPLGSAALPTGAETSATFAYSNYVRQYCFTLQTEITDGTGVNEAGQQWYRILPDGQNGQYINASAGGKNFVANLYPIDGHEEMANAMALIPVSEGSFTVSEAGVEATGASVFARTVEVAYGHTYQYAAHECNFFTAGENNPTGKKSLCGNFDVTYNYTIAEGAKHGAVAVGAEISEPADGMTALLQNAEGNFIAAVPENDETPVVTPEAAEAANYAPEYIWQYSADNAAWVNTVSGETTTAADLTAYSYTAQAYFKVTYTIKAGTTVETVEVYAPAGSAVYATQHVDDYIAPTAAIVEELTENTVIEDPVVYTIDPLTSISEIEAVSPAAVDVYDLQGRRCSRAARGLYIVNGVKTLVK